MLSGTVLEDNKLTEKFKDGVPAVFDWVTGNQSCDEAVKNRSSYAWKMGAKVINSPELTFFFTPQVTYSLIFSYCIPLFGVCRYQ